MYNKPIKCLNHGFVKLVDSMPSGLTDDDTVLSIESAIVQAARVSYGHGIKTPEEDRGLIRYLMRHRHTTPFEMVEFKFHCKMPIFVARQWIRHRTASVNEISGRYSEMRDEFYIPTPESCKTQSGTNKQGRGSILSVTEAEQFITECEMTATDSYQTYLRNIKDDGISKELARINLPLSLYTEWYWKIDLHNLLHFLSLRCDSHAQEEIRVFAEAMLTLITPLVPITIQAWNDYHPMRGAMILTAQEITIITKHLEWLQNYLEELDSKADATSFYWSDELTQKLGLGKTEKAEAITKFKRLGLEVLS